jgi:hypothetical protein
VGQKALLIRIGKILFPEAPAIKLDRRCLRQQWQSAHDQFRQNTRGSLEMN